MLVPYFQSLRTRLSPHTLVIKLEATARNKILSNPELPSEVAEIRNVAQASLRQEDVDTFDACVVSIKELGRLNFQQHGEAGTLRFVEELRNISANVRNDPRSRSFVVKSINELIGLRMGTGQESA